MVSWGRLKEKSMRILGAFGALYLIYESWEDCPLSLWPLVPCWVLCREQNSRQCQQMVDHVSSIRRKHFQMRRIFDIGFIRFWNEFATSTEPMWHVFTKTNPKITADKLGTNNFLDTSKVPPLLGLDPRGRKYWSTQHVSFKLHKSTVCENSILFTAVWQWHWTMYIHCQCQSATLPRLSSSSTCMESWIHRTNSNLRGRPITITALKYRIRFQTSI